MRIARLATGDEHIVLGGADLFDGPPTDAFTEKFLALESHHLLAAFDDDGAAIGFVTGVETTHPDKGTAMFLCELSVGEQHRGQGVGRALVRAGRARAPLRLLRHVGRHRSRQRGSARDVSGGRRRSA